MLLLSFVQSGCIVCLSVAWWNSRKLRNSSHSAPPCPRRCASPRGRQRETPYPLGRSCQPEQRGQGDGFRHPRGRRGAGHGGDGSFFRLPAGHSGAVGGQRHPARVRQAQGVPAGKICPSVSRVIFCSCLISLWNTHRAASWCVFWVVEWSSVVCCAQLRLATSLSFYLMIIIKEILT